LKADVDCEGQNDCTGRDDEPQSSAKRQQDTVPRDTTLFQPDEHLIAVQRATLSKWSHVINIILLYLHVREPFAKFVDWRQCAAVMRREAVTVMPSCSGGVNVVVAWFSSL
jgi:hypothetical protein